MKPGTITVISVPSHDQSSLQGLAAIQEHVDMQGGGFRGPHLQPINNISGTHRS